MKKQDPKFYDSYTEDFVTSSNQNCEVKDNYKWLNNNIFYKLISTILYFLAYIIALIYCKLILKVSFKNKKVLKEYGLPVVDYVSFFSMEYIKDEEKIQKEIKEKLRFPVIVKPGNLGSSVGIKKANNESELIEAIEFAMEFSDRIIVENAVENLKEINCSVIGNIVDSETSVCEEPFFSDEILSYADKYMGGSKSNKGVGIKGGAKGIAGAKAGGKGMAVSDKKLPADISDEKRDEIQKLTKETFKVLGCSGVARVDFLMDKKTEKVYVNEINTIPGALSYYLWEATGKSFEKELDELIDIALKRHREREKLTFSYDQNILAMQGGTKGSKGMKGTK